MDSKFKVLTWDQREEWNLFIEEFDINDIYFTAEYNKIYEDNKDGIANILVFENENILVAYPFLKRKINLNEIFKDYKEDIFDIATAYGYGGPILKVKNLNCNIDIEMEKYKKIFNEYCINENIVSEFVRFHPIIENHKDFNMMYDIKHHNKTVFNKLDKDIEEIWNSELKKNARNAVRKANKSGVEVFKCDIKSKNYNDVLNEFKQLYYSTMDKNKASDYYYFNKKYFTNMSKLLGDNIKIFYARYNKKIIAASLVMIKNGNVHIHLTGSNKEYLDIKPNNIVRYEIIKWAKYKGYNIVHHGGGTTSDENDNLFKYKQLFSSKVANFYLGKKIHNKEIYDELCKINEKLNMQENINYFPLYRYGV